MKDLKSINEDLYEIDILLSFHLKIIKALDEYNKKLSNMLFKVGFYKLKCKRKKHTWEVNHSGLSNNTLRIMDGITLSYYSCKYCNRFKLERKTPDLGIFIPLAYSYSQFCQHVLNEKTRLIYFRPYNNI